MRIEQKKHLFCLFLIEEKRIKMQFCNFCAKNSEQVKQINGNKVKIGSDVIKINNLLQIFQNDIVKVSLIPRFVLAP